MLLETLVVVMLGAQLCLILCNPMNYNPQGSSVHELYSVPDTFWAKILQLSVGTGGENTNEFVSKSISIYLVKKGAHL